MGHDREGGIAGSLRQAQQRFPDFVGHVQLWLINIKPPQAKEGWDHLGRLADLLAQRTRLGIGVLYFGAACLWS